MDCKAVISECGQYRYVLSRRWAPGRLCVFVMLNPSTADALADDPTIRRCVAFAKTWGYSGIIVVNIFAFRATSPGDMKRVPDPFGPENEAYVEAALKRASREKSDVICAWGNHGSHRKGSDKFLGLVKRAGLEGLLKSLGVNSSGEPKHPLYIKGDTAPDEYINRA